MKQITSTEKYALCMLKELKHFNNAELSDYLLMCMIVEMMLEKSIEIKDYNNEKKPFEESSKVKIKLTNNAPKSEYNKEFYQIIMEMNNVEIAIDELIARLCHGKSGYSDRNLKIITEALEEKMIQDGLITRENKKTIFGNREKIIINDDKFGMLVEEIRSTLLKKNKYSNDFILVISFLNATSVLKNLFLKYEKKTLKKKMDSLKDNSIPKYAKLAGDILESYDGIVIV